MGLRSSQITKQRGLSSWDFHPEKGGQLGGTEHSKEVFGLNSIANGFEGMKDAAVKTFDNFMGTAYKTIGEFTGVNNAIRVGVGVEPWSITASNSNSTVHLDSGKRLDAGLDMARSALTGGLLSTASHLSDFGNNTSNIFGLTKTLETGVANGNNWSLIEKGYNFFNIGQAVQETFKGFETQNKLMAQ